MRDYGLFMLTYSDLAKGLTFETKRFYDGEQTLKQHLYRVKNYCDSPDCLSSYDCIVEACDDFRYYLSKGDAVALVDFSEGAIIKIAYPEKD